MAKIKEKLILLCTVAMQTGIVYIRMSITQNNRTFNLRLLAVSTCRHSLVSNRILCIANRADILHTDKHVFEAKG